MAKINLTERDQVSAGTSTYEVARIEIAFIGDPYVGIALVGENGEQRSVIFTKNDAVDLVAAINASSAPLKNLRKIALQKVLSTGQLNGSMA